MNRQIIIITVILNEDWTYIQKSLVKSELRSKLVAEWNQNQAIPIWLVGYLVVYLADLVLVY